MTFADFARTATLVELAPHQVAMLEALERGDFAPLPPADHYELELEARRQGRRFRAAHLLAAAALGGHDVRIAASDSASARETAELAAEVLATYGAACGRDVELARRRLLSMAA